MAKQISAPVKFGKNAEVATVTNADFYSGMSLLKSKGYNPISLGEALLFKNDSASPDESWFTHYVSEGALLVPGECLRVLNVGHNVLEQIASQKRGSSISLSSDLAKSLMDDSVPVPNKYIVGSENFNTYSIPFEALEGPLGNSLLGPHSKDAISALESKGVASLTIWAPDNFPGPQIRPGLLYGTDFGMKLDLIGQSLDKTLRALRGIKYKG